jgi:hypothetical protein
VFTLNQTKLSLKTWTRALRVRVRFAYPTTSTILTIPSSSSSGMIIPLPLPLLILLAVVAVVLSGFLQKKRNRRRAGRLRCGGRPGVFAALRAVPSGELHPAVDSEHHLVFTCVACAPLPLSTGSKAVAKVCVYYCSTYYKAVRVGGGG